MIRKTIGMATYVLVEIIFQRRYTPVMKTKVNYLKKHYKIFSVTMS